MLRPKALSPPGLELDDLTRSRCTICAGAIATQILIARNRGDRWEQESSVKESLEKLVSDGRLFLWGESAVPFF